MAGRLVLHIQDIGRASNIESDNSQNFGLEDYNNISDEIFPHFTTSSIISRVDTTSAIYITLP